MNDTENLTINIKRSPLSNNNLSSQIMSSNVLREVNTILYTANSRQYQIKVSHHLHSWDIPYKYYYGNMDPVKAFLQNNRIKDHNNRFYWSNKQTFYGEQVLKNG